MKTVTFLGWSNPLTELAAPMLLNSGTRYDGGPSVDLSSLLVLIPGRAASRSLMEKMTLLLQPFSGGIFPPEFYTPERFLLEGAENEHIASELEQLRVWKQVLTECDKNEFRVLFPIDFPENNDAVVNNLAAQFTMLKRELSTGAKDMAEVQRSGCSADTERWSQIAELERRYTEILADLNMIDPEDLKIQLSETAEPFRKFSKIIVLAAPDLSTILLKRLAKAAEIMNVELWVNAPFELESMFDGWGRPIPEKWTNYPIGFGSFSENPDDDDFTKHIFKTETTGQLAAIAAALLAETRGTLAETSVAIADETLFDPLRKELSKLKIKDSPGRTLIVTTPSGEPMRKLRLCDLLGRFKNFMASSDFNALRELVLHEDFLAFLSERIELPQETILNLLDDFYMNHIPETSGTALQCANRNVMRILLFLKKQKEELQTIPAPEAIRTFLNLVYQNGGLELFSSGIPLQSEWEEITGLLDRIQLSPLFRKESVAEILTEILTAAGKTRLYREPIDNEFSIGGFLELPWNGARRLILCGMNDGAIPESVHGSTFLSDSMRAKLGLQCNQRRFGRDVLYLESLIQSRGRENLYFLASRYDSAGKPLKFSRLFFQGTDQDIFDRAAILFDPVRFPEMLSGDKRQEYHFRLSPDFSLAEKTDRLCISVTQFREYIKSPFRFFLGNFMKMQEKDYDVNELDRGAFGSCCHEALEKTGHNPSSDPETVKTQLFEALDTHMRKQYGSPLPVLIAIQNEQMKQRLAWAAQLIAESVREFKVLECEYVLGGEANGVEFDGVTIRGRIDRIEYSASQNLLRLIDYKTTDSGDAPEKVHYSKRSGKFSDLQLPLYRMLILLDPHFREQHPEIDLNSVRILCGYLTMPKSVTETQFLFWNDMDSVMPQAEELVSEIIAGIKDMKNGIFHENPDRKIPYDKFAPYLLPDLRSAVPTAQWVQTENENE